MDKGWVKEKRERQRLKCRERKEERLSVLTSASLQLMEGPGSWGTCVPRFDVGTFIQVRFLCHGANLLVYYANELSSAVHFSRTFWKWVRGL